MWNDIQQSDTECPKCSNLLVWRDCQELDCQDGIITDESDPGYDVSSYYCPTCKAKGIEQWCQSCGYGVN